MVKVCVAEVSTPPLAVPPLSCSCTVTVARAVGVGRRRVGQRAVGVDRRLHREQRRCCCCVTMKFNGLAGFVGRAGRDAGRPARRRVCAPASSSTVWSAPLVNARRVVDRVTVIVKVCGAEVSTPPLAVPPLSCSVHA